MDALQSPFLLPKASLELLTNSAIASALRPGVLKLTYAQHHAKHFKMLHRDSLHSLLITSVTPSVYLLIRKYTGVSFDSQNKT